MLKGARMPAVWESLTGQVVDEFPLLQYLGGSARSAVYLTNRRVNGVGQKAVIKLMDARSADADFRFSRWQSAAQLSHPHLIRLFGAGRFELNGTPLFYAVMEYAEENLSQLLPSRPLTPAEARDVLEPVLDALAYLHRQGFVHGALKPGNIMAINDELKLAVDGLYRVGDRVPPLSETLPYDAPERAQGAISAATDMWSLGVTLVEALTQLTPSRRTADQSEPILPQMLPEVFHDVAQHCLAVDPAQRWTVSEVSARLNPTAPVRKAFAAPQEPLPSKPSPYSRWLVAGAAVVVFAILIGWLMARRKPGDSTSSPGPSKSEAVPVPKPSTPPEAAPQKPSPVVEPHAPRSNRTAGENTNSAPEPAASEAAGAANNIDLGGDQSEVVHQVIPSVPRSARDTITGRVKVRVKVKVGPEGNVSDAEFVNPGPSQYFARLAMQAARGWKFRPGQDTSREWTLRFEFGRSGTTVHPARGAP
jgi:TonB family protein